MSSVLNVFFLVPSDGGVLREEESGMMEDQERGFCRRQVDKKIMKRCCC